MGTLTNNCTAFASDATVGVVAISTPPAAQLIDASYATSVLLGSQQSNYLKITGYQFAIPLDATVTGVTANVTRHSTVGATTVDGSLRLVVAGVISGNDKASASTWGTSDATINYGSSTDLWGLTLAPTDINNAGFGVVLSASTTLAATADIDCISLTVSYTGSNKSGNRIRTLKTSGGVSISEGAN